MEQLITHNEAMCKRRSVSECSTSTLSSTNSMEFTRSLSSISESGEYFNQSLLCSWFSRLFIVLGWNPNVEYGIDCQLKWPKDIGPPNYHHKINKMFGKWGKFLLDKAKLLSNVYCEWKLNDWTQAMGANEWIRGCQRRGYYVQFSRKNTFYFISVLS